MLLFIIIILLASGCGCWIICCWSCWIINPETVSVVVVPVLVSDSDADDAAVVAAEKAVGSIARSMRELLAPKYFNDGLDEDDLDDDEPSIKALSLGKSKVDKLFVDDDGQLVILCLLLFIVQSFCAAELVVLLLLLLTTTVGK